MTLPSLSVGRAKPLAAAHIPTVWMPQHPTARCWEDVQEVWLDRRLGQQEPCGTSLPNNWSGPLGPDGSSGMN